MLIFSYDSSFDGLLSAVFDAYTQRRFPEALIGREDSPPMLAAEVHTVDSITEKTGRVARGLANILSRAAMGDLILAWLSEEEGAATAVFRYIRKTFDAKRSLEHDLADPEVLAVILLAKKTRSEVHRLEGFVRFQKTAEGIYFAALSPRHNVLTLLLGHFADRFADQRWILYDVKRRYGFFHEQGHIRDMFLEEGAASDLARNRGRLEDSLLAENEQLLQDLWQGYFKATAIAERINPRLQQRCMPRRYWEYLTEMQ